MVSQLQELNQTRLQNFKLQIQPQSVPVSGFSLSKVTYQNILVSADLDPDLDTVQVIARVFSKPSNN